MNDGNRGEQLVVALEVVQWFIIEKKTLQSQFRNRLKYDLASPSAAVPFTVLYV